MDDPLVDIAPSPFVRRFATRMVKAAGTKPILDVACGGGRNAILLSHFGAQVICIDIDLSRLESERVRLSETIFAEAFSRIQSVSLDLLNDKWPFDPLSAGGVVNVHFHCPALFPAFADVMVPGGFLLLETVPGHGGNYLQLPVAGSLRDALQKSFELDVYRERNAGRADHKAVTARLLGVKRNHH